MAFQKSAMKGVKFSLQSAATTGNGTVAAIPPSFKQHKIYIKGSAGVSAGAVQIEAASVNDYSGTWGQIGGGPITVTADVENQIDFSGQYRFIRARISTTVVDGTVTVDYEGGL